MKELFHCPASVLSMFEGLRWRGRRGRQRGNVEEEGGFSSELLKQKTIINFPKKNRKKCYNCNMGETTASHNSAVMEKNNLP